MNGMFNDLFRPLEKGMCRMSPKGIAVKTSSGFTAYNRSTGSLVQCDGVTFDLGDNAFFVIPTNRVKEGDIIIDHGKPAYVKAVDKNLITVLSYESGRVETLVPCRHIFMEQVYFYQKIVSVLGDGSFMTRKKGVGKLMQMMMLSQMMKGGEETHAGLPGTLTQLLLMKSLGAGDLFEGLEDAFDGDEEDEKAEEVSEP